MGFGGTYILAERDDGWRRGMSRVGKEECVVRIRDNDEPPVSEGFNMACLK